MGAGEGGEKDKGERHIELLVMPVTAYVFLCIVLVVDVIVAASHSFP